MRAPTKDRDGPSIKTTAVFVRMLRTGAPRNSVYRAAGVSKPTFYKWLRNGKDPENFPKEAAFREAVIQAEGQAIVDSTNTVMRAVKKGEWKAAMAWLRARVPEFQIQKKEAPKAQLGDVSSQELRNALLSALQSDPTPPKDPEE